MTIFVTMSQCQPKGSPEAACEAILRSHALALSQELVTHMLTNGCAHMTGAPSK